MSEGDRIVAHTRYSGTQQGTFMGVPGHGQRLSVEAMDMWRVANGRLAEHWDVLDQLTMLRQLGVLPPA